MIALSGVGYRTLRGVDLELGERETLALLGPSGAGKSTILRLILGLAAPTTGEIRVGGVLASAAGRVLVPPEERGLGMVFQDLALWPHLTVAGNLAFMIGGRRDPIPAALAAVGLEGLGHRRPGELSGGERQRVAIARALVARPRALLLDEPLANLDVALRAELGQLFRRVIRDAGVPAIHVTHDPREARRLADRLAILEEGRIVQIGTAAEIAASPATAFARAVAGEL